MITTSRSIPKGIGRVAWLAPKRPAFRSIAAILSLCTIAADFFDTIFIAAAWPVMACLASLTRPVAPLPRVLPSCHGPTCVFRFPFPEAVDVVDIAEFLLEAPVDSVATDRRAVSATTAGEFDVIRGGPTSMDLNCSPFTAVQSTRGVATVGPWLTLVVASVRGLRPCGERVLPPLSMLDRLPLL